MSLSLFSTSNCRAATSWVLEFIYNPSFRRKCNWAQFERTVMRQSQRHERCPWRQQHCPGKSGSARGKIHKKTQRNTMSRLHYLVSISKEQSLELDSVQQKQKELTHWQLIYRERQTDRHMDRQMIYIYEEFRCKSL